ncbi:MAG TPA: 16S rRNA (guanine(966)-N(2))-methyltransferase RsmD [Tepidisphaeraceae bacterium]|nr:16S rRNA (guanine(966)-N(2))-methyltransferase RsmD [Tepidisphaeraceae bacterium]
MRIIAGEFRGRKLLPPETEATRPITDRVKQSLFDILTPCLDGATVYDCFAGTGSLGLESLSRGAEHAVFFETDRSAAALLRRNIAALGLGARSTVIRGDVFSNLHRATTPASIVFLDPPYRMLSTQPDDLRKLAAAICENHLAPEGLVILRHSIGDRIDLPPLRRIDMRSYGKMRVELLSK